MTYVFEWVVGFVSGGRHSVFAVPGATFTIGVYWIWVPVPAARKKTFWQIQVAPSTLDFNSFYTACHDISSVKGPWPKPRPKIEPLQYYLMWIKIV